MNHSNSPKSSKKTKAGDVPGGISPLGYRAVRETASLHEDRNSRIKTKWEINPETAPLVALAFEMRAKGKSIDEIMKSSGELSRIMKGHNANEQ